MVLQVVLEFENGSREEELFVAGRPFLICSGGVLGSFLKIRLFYYLDFLLVVFLKPETGV